MDRPRLGWGEIASEIFAATGATAVWAWVFHFATGWTLAFWSFTVVIALLSLRIDIEDRAQGDPPR